MLPIGGTSQIPCGGIRTQFGADVVREDRPFEAAHGALKLALGMGLDDFVPLLRCAAPEPADRSPRVGGDHPGGRALSRGAGRVDPTASRDGQEALELVIGEVEESSTGLPR